MRALRLADGRGRSCSGATRSIAVRTGGASSTRCSRRGARTAIAWCCSPAIATSTSCASCASSAASHRAARRRTRRAASCSAGSSRPRWARRTRSPIARRSWPRARAVRASTTTRSCAAISTISRPAVRCARISASADSDGAPARRCSCTAASPPRISASCRVRRRARMSMRGSSRSIVSIATSSRDSRPGARRPS